MKKFSMKTSISVPYSFVIDPDQRIYIAKILIFDESWLQINLNFF